MPDPTLTVDLEDAAAVFNAVRTRLIGIACRIVGNRSDAEDVVQDAWLRWQLCDRSKVLNPTAFLVTTTTRLAINTIQSARARRESYVAQWLPEPVATADDPALDAERGDRLEHGIHLLLERLNPAERGAFVLREGFGYPYPEIAGMLRTTEANARQLASRAGKRIAGSRPASRVPLAC